MSREDLEAKCSDLLVPVLGRSRARRLIDTVWGIERVKDARQLRPLLRR